MTGATPLVEVRGLVKEFDVRGHRSAGLVRAVAGVDLEPVDHLADHQLRRRRHAP